MLTDRAYLTLRPDERLQAALSATARHDMPELDRLITTCERKSYRMEDQDFMHPLRGFLRMAERHRAHLLYSLLGGMTVAGLIEAVEEDTPETSERLDKLAGAIKGRLEAWDAFCRDVGLSVDEIARLDAEIRGDDIIAFALDVLCPGDTPTNDAMGLKYLGELRAEWERLNA